MSDNKRKILELLESGAISQEDAQRLLAALGTEDGAEPSEPPPQIGDLPDMPDSPDFPDVVSDGAGNTQWRWNKGGIREISLSWVSGNVEVRPWNEEGVRVTEFADRSLWEDECMDVTEQNGTLKIRWMKKKSSMFLNSSSTPGKNVLLELPQGCVERLKLSVVSADTQLRDISCAACKLITVSGDVQSENLKAEKVVAESVSGDVTLRFSAQPTSVNASSVSGELRLALPEDVKGFTADYGTTSGDFQCAFSCTGEQRTRGGTVSYGNGAAQLRLHTVSGNMSIHSL